jgi:2-polyprenyl-3-methyl-5-hydroxy-6-metoxy-1,4-benzoquinol methylase
MAAENFRYSLKPDPYSSHGQIAAWLQHYRLQHWPQRPGVVYDIGCAQGLLGQLLPSTDFTLYGVDSDPASVEVARTTYRAVWQSDIEQPLAFQFPEPADVMILADVLEHTREPEVCLTRLCQTLLSAGTPIVISLPNVAHLYVRLALLAGRFEYAARGICDHTHVRFFTRASAVRLCAGCGITIDRVAATPVPLPLLNARFQPGRPLWPVHRAQAAAARWFKTVLGYQIIIYGRYRG